MPGLTADHLRSLGYFGLFQQQDGQAVNALWHEDDAPAALRSLVHDANADQLARFLSAEILFAEEPGYPPEQDRDMLAGLYATALRDNYTESANTWGLPGISEGLVGQHVVALGSAMVPAFLALLDDESRLQYEGSEEATIGAINSFRVKDVAAALISQVLNRPFRFEKDPKRRDRTIATLKRAATR